MKKNNVSRYFATTAKGLEGLLFQELQTLGMQDVKETVAGVYFSTDLKGVYHALLWSRLANRILYPLKEAIVASEHDLYHAVQKVDWSKHVTKNGSLYVHFTESQSSFSHTLYGAQKVKDAIVDQFRERFGERPSVKARNADIHINVHVNRDKAVLSLDLSGESLHKRGYREDAGLAPLKENLAAALLIRAKWGEYAAKGLPIVDPMCGSGTLLIEAAFIALDRAPGLERQYYGFLGWLQHDAKLWESELHEARQRYENASKHLPRILGYDRDSVVLKTAKANIERAGLHDVITLECASVEALQARSLNESGLFIVNPPYGERMGEIMSLQSLYRTLGAQLKTEFAGWHVAIFTANFDLCKETKLRAKKYYAFYNGKIPCRLFLFDVPLQLSE